MNKNTVTLANTEITRESLLAYAKKHNIEVKKTANFETLLISCIRGHEAKFKPFRGARKIKATITGLFFYTDNKFYIRAKAGAKSFVKQLSEKVEILDLA